MDVEDDEGNSDQGIFTYCNRLMYNHHYQNGNGQEDQEGDNQSIAFNSDISTQLDNGEDREDREDIQEFLLEADEVIEFLSQNTF